MSSTKGFAWLQYAEPARLRAVWVAIVSLLAALGITLGTQVDSTVGVVIGAVGAVLALVQGEWTRGAVFSPETHAAAVEQAAAAAAPPAGPPDPYAGEPG